MSDLSDIDTRGSARTWGTGRSCLDTETCLGLPFDLSAVTFVATANSWYTVTPDRMALEFLVYLCMGALSPGALG